VPDQNEAISSHVNGINVRLIMKKILYIIIDDILHFLNFRLMSQKSMEMSRFLRKSKE
jgi:hypothetical protein